MAEKVLIIGYLHQHVDSFYWWNELPNLSDYDTIIVDATSILSRWAGRLKPLRENASLLSKIDKQDERLRSNLDLVERSLLEMLRFPVTVYGLYAPETTVERTGGYSPTGVGYRTFIRTNDWCPISIETVVEKGKTILVKDTSYEEYFKGFKGWEYYFNPASVAIRALERFHGDKYAVTYRLHSIATNKVEKPIAIQFFPLFHRWAHDEEGGFFSQPDYIGGPLVLLPVANQLDTKRCIEVLLQRRKQFDETPPPSWISSVEIPSEASLKAKIDTKKQQLEQITSRIEKLQSQLAELQKPRGLLYESGLTLQELVKSTLEKLGVNTKPSVVTDEFIIEVNGKEALIEVKGNTKSITKDDVAQLVTDLMQHLKTTGQEIDGILIGNGWRLEPLEKRDSKDKLIFSRDAKRVAQNHNLGLISTTELFEAYRKLLEDPQQKESILNKIINGKGVITF